METLIYPTFGSVMPTRSWSDGTREYRFGFNTQEKDNEVAGTGNSYSAEFWQYDGRLGRRFNLDPMPNIGTSNFSCFSNSPILYSDHNGDTLSGANKSSARKTRHDIRSNFGGFKNRSIRKLFKIHKSTFKPISPEQLMKAIGKSDLSYFQMMLLVGYVAQVNSFNNSIVEYVRRNQKVSNTARRLGMEMLGGDFWRWGLSFDNAYFNDTKESNPTYGGFSFENYDYHFNCYVIIVKNRRSKVIFKNKADGAEVQAIASNRNVLAHELLGHSLGYYMNSRTYLLQDAVQMSNIVFAMENSLFYYPATSHGAAALNLVNETGIPTYINELFISVMTQFAIRGLMDSKDFVTPKENMDLK